MVVEGDFPEEAASIFIAVPAAGWMSEIKILNNII